MRQAYWAYMETINNFSSPIQRPDDRAPKQKRFWSFIKSLRKDSSGFSPLRSEGEIHSSAEMLNQQFTSVFTQKPPGPLQDKGPSPHPTMPDICQS